MTYLLRAFALLCLLAAPVAAAEENWYEYGLRVLISPPLTVTGSGSATWTVRVPGYASVGQVYVKNCRVWGLHAAALEFDEHITLYQAGADWYHGAYKFVIGDRKEGRTQTYCLRLPYIPLTEEEPAP